MFARHLASRYKKRESSCPFLAGWGNKLEGYLGDPLPVHFQDLELIHARPANAPSDILFLGERTSINPRGFPSVSKREAKTSEGHDFGLEISGWTVPISIRPWVWRNRASNGCHGGRLMAVARVHNFNLCLLLCCSNKMPSRPSWLLLFRA